MRQVVQALICRYRDQITKLTLSLNATSISRDALKNLRMKRNRTSPHKIFEVEDLATPLHVQMTQRDRNAKLTISHRDGSTRTTASIGYDELNERGCHGVQDPSDMTAFYREGVPVPNTIPECSDDLTLVEFGSVIRFYFIFHPDFYNNNAILEAYRQLEMATTTTDDNGQRYSALNHLIFNLDDTSIIARKSLSFDNVVSKLGQTQHHSIGRYFGADNPWISRPPDKLHACMPGIPDDEVNLLLFELLGGM